MPITKETAKELGRMGGKQNVKNKHDLWDYVASGGMRLYHEALQSLYAGKKPTKEQQEAMDRTERLFPYVKSKAVETHKHEHTFPQPIEDV